MRAGRLGESMETRALFRGPAHVMVCCTDPKYDNVIGLPAREAFPEYIYRDWHRATDRVYRTGQCEAVDITTIEEVTGVSLLVRIDDDEGRPWGLAAEFRPVAVPRRPRL